MPIATDTRVQDLPPFGSDALQIAYRKAEDAL
jgi:hypothetical protein